MRAAGGAGDPGDGDRAEVLHRVLLERFWSTRDDLFRIREGRRLLPFGEWDHWWQSHAVAALLDRHDRTGDRGALDLAQRAVEGMRRRGGGRLTNAFYDDMGWLALELLRMPGRADDVEALLAAVRKGAARDGGVAWSTRHPEFRNTPATGPAAILALRWGARSADDALLAWGLSLVDWLAERVVAPDGAVHDGVRDVGAGRVEVDRARYSYNYGLVVGASLEAAALTGDGAYAARAAQVAHAALRDLTDPVTGVWRSEGRGDGALFRGILARHLAAYARSSGDAAVLAALRVQADAVWSSCAGGPVGEWPARPGHRVSLAEHVGGLLVVEAALTVAPPRG